jgi:hypothetical protein
MKKLLILLFLPLSGCALYDAYFMAKYDTNEYALVNSIKTKSFLAQSECGDRNKTIANVTDMYNTNLEILHFIYQKTMMLPKWQKN